MVSLLRCDGQPDEVIAAGLLHDVLEKTATTSAELRHRFSVRVGRLVESVSDNPSIGDYKARKRYLRARVAHANSDTAAVFAADKIAKVHRRRIRTHTHRSLERPSPVWTRVTRTRMIAERYGRFSRRGRWLASGRLADLVVALGNAA